MPLGVTSAPRPWPTRNLDEESPLASELKPTGRAWLRRIGEHKVVTGAASSVLAASVLGTWGLLSGWIGGENPAPTATVASTEQAANFEGLGFGTALGVDNFRAGRLAEPGQTLEVCPEEPLIGWLRHDLAPGGSIRLRWLHEGEPIREERYEVGTGNTWYRVDPPLAPGSYVLEAEAGADESAAWNVFVQTLDAADPQCATPEPAASPATD